MLADRVRIGSGRKDAKEQLWQEVERSVGYTEFQYTNLENDVLSRMGVLGNSNYSANEHSSMNNTTYLYITKNDTTINVEFVWRIEGSNFYTRMIGLI